MKKHGKKYKAVKEKVSVKEPLSIDSGIAKVKELAYASFDESVDVNVNLGIDPAKGEHAVRGSIILPHRIGKDVKILVFAKGEYADQALKAGADYIGTNDFVEKIEGGWLDFDYAIATPDLMGLVGKLAKILGPRGLLPNKKLGTVTFDIEAVVADLKKGRSFFKNDKSGLVHFLVGKLSLTPSQIKDNLVFFIHALNAARPAKAKGKFIKKVTISSTMGVGIPVDVDELIKV